MRVLKPALSLSGLLLLPILLLHIQRFDDPALRGLLRAPEGCAAPCFMAIRPGVTSEEEALRLLADHRWVGQMTNQPPVSYQIAQVPINLNPSWFWSAARPAGIDGQSQGVLGIRNARVDYFEIGTLFRYGELRLLLGEPDEEQAWTWTDNAQQVFKYAAWFASAQVEAIVKGVCPARRLAFYPVVIRLRSDAPDMDQDTDPGLCA